MLLYSGLVVATSLASAGANYAQYRRTGEVFMRVVRDFRLRLFTHLLSLPMSYLCQKDSREISAQFGYAHELGERNVKVPIRLANSLVAISLNVLAIFCINWKLCLTLLPISALVLYLGLRFGSQFHDLQLVFRRHERRLARTAADSFARRIAVQFMGLQRYEIGRFSEQARRFSDVGHRQVEVEACYQTDMGSVADFLTRSLLIIVAAWLLVSLGHPQGGTIAALILYASRLKSGVLDYVKSFTDFHKAGGGVQAALDLMAVEPEAAGARAPRISRPLRGQITFENVWFSYRKGADTVRSVSFEASPGETLAIVGPTGSGKSTILSLLTRLYEPRRGRIRIDGHDLETIDHRNLAHHLALVPQDAALFHGTIRENLRIQNPVASEAEMVLALEDVRADFVFDPAIAPLGLDTPVGEEGRRFSGGQRQRIALARALLRRPRILLLDEATSALDERTERALLQTIEERMQGGVILKVAHRLKSVWDADRILVVRRGSIVESGSHEDLLRAGGLYRELWLKECIAEDPGAGEAPTEPRERELARAPKTRACSSAFRPIPTAPRACCTQEEAPKSRRRIDLTIFWRMLQVSDAVAREYVQEHRASFWTCRGLFLLHGALLTCIPFLGGQILDLANGGDVAGRSLFGSMTTAGWLALYSLLVVALSFMHVGTELHYWRAMGRLNVGLREFFNHSMFRHLSFLPMTFWQGRDSRVVANHFFEVGYVGEKNIKVPISITRHYLPAWRAISRRTPRAGSTPPGALGA